MAFRLIPRDESFYPPFDNLATDAVKASKLLKDLLSSIPVDNTLVVRIVEAERKADEIQRALLRQLERSIVTPFDREDIYTLVDKLDDVFDAMRSAAELAQQHHLSQKIDGIDRFTDLLIRITERNVSVINRLKNLGNINEDVAIIDQLETEGDVVHRELVGELYSGKYEALEVLRWTNVIERIEKAINAVEKTARIVQSVAIKHS
jgi:uncharacterized protein